MQFTLKRFDTTPRRAGREGLAFSFDLYIDGKLACHVRQDGIGGEHFVTWHDPTAKERLQQYVDERPERIIDFGDGKPWTMPRCVNTLMDELADSYSTDRRFKRIAKDRIIFKLPSDGPAADWKTLRLPALFHGKAWNQGPSDFFKGWCKTGGIDPSTAVVFNATGTVWGV